ncbi:MAG: hypothetical protein JXR73_04110 [Candidatus Omnitrophica bacterium]|nr:hypothetical protein [Candidatus Omnitrophota bacterium]
MMTFANEQDVRMEARLFDFDEVSSETAGHCLKKAHDDILAGTILTDESEADGIVKAAEARLAVSHIFRSLVLSSAVSDRNWKLSGIQMDENIRIQNLMKLSQELWEEAWDMLTPYLRCSAPAFLQVVKGGSE